jgi:serine/threonine protein kinase
MPSNSPRDALELIILLCTYNPDLRITAHRALKHRYFNLLREDTRENLELQSQGSSRIALQAAALLPVQQIDPNLQKVQEIQEMYKPLYKKNSNVSKKKYLTSKMYRNRLLFYFKDIIEALNEVVIIYFD